MEVRSFRRGTQPLDASWVLSTIKYLFFARMFIETCSPSFPLLPCAFIDIPSSFSVCKLSTLSRLVSGSSCVIIIFKNLAAAVAVAAAAAESVDGDGRTRLMEGRR